MFSIGFLSPAFLVGTLAVAVPIALHLLKRAPTRTVPFPALRLLRAVPAPESRRQQIQRFLLLALRMSVLVLLAVSFARPYLTGAAAARVHPVTVVAIDISFSMSAPGQFDRARRLARAIVQSPDLGGGIRRQADSGQVALVAFSDAATVVVPPTSDRSRVVAALDHLQPGFGATRYRLALARAAELLAEGAGRVVLVTDLQRAGWQGDDLARLPAGVDVDVRDAGSPPGNLACIDLHRAQAGLEAVVRNLGTTDVTTRVHFAIDGRVLASRPLTIAAASASQVTFEGPLPARGAAVATIDDPRGYQADNARYLVLDPPAPASLLLVTGERQPAADAFYVDRALGVDGGRLFAVSGRTSDRLSGVDPSELRRYAAVVMLGTRGLEARGRRALVEYVRGGGGLLVTAGPDTDPDVVRDILTADHTPAVRSAAPPLTLAIADARHPILRALTPLAANAAEVRVTRAVGLPDEASRRVLLRFSDASPALVEVRIAAGRVLVFASDLGNHWNDLPLQPMFLPLVHEIVRYLSAGREPAQQYTIGQLPPGVPATPGVVTLADTAPTSSGKAAGASRPVAVNVDIMETDPSRVSLEEFKGLVEAAREDGGKPSTMDSARQVEEPQQWWRYGLLLMLVALVAEAFVARATA